MRIAQIPPLVESVPPKLYGGTERIVSYLTEELIAQGHEVTLFASGDSRTEAELVVCCPESLRLAGTHDRLANGVLQLEAVRKRAPEFDILHFHVDYLHFPLVRQMGSRSVTTMHGRMDLPDYPRLFGEFKDMPLVSVSDDQREPLKANWVATVLHGLPTNLYRFSEAGAAGYLAFLGRMSREKRPDRAIRIARRAGIELKMAAKIGAADRAFFERAVVPLLDTPGVAFLGEIGEAEKNDFLGGARALLFPIEWPEPFGLAMIEAMACGTPVIAWRSGAIPEVVEDGVTGFIVDSIDDAVAAIERAGALDRARVRARFEERFTAERMANDYVSVYEYLCRTDPKEVRARAAAGGGPLTSNPGVGAAIRRGAPGRWSAGAEAKNASE